MSTRAAKLKAVAPPAEVGARRAVPLRITIKKGKETRDIENALLADLLTRAFGLYSDIRAVEPELKKLKSAIFEELEPEFDGNGTITLVLENMVCKITQGWEYLIDEKDIPALQDALGDRFADLVTIKRSYKPEKKLVELCFEGDTPEVIRAAVQAKEKSPVFSFSVAAQGV